MRCNTLWTSLESFLSAFSTIVSRLGKVEGRTRKPARMIQRKMFDQKLFQEEIGSNIISVYSDCAIVLMLREVLEVFIVVDLFGASGLWVLVPRSISEP